MAVFGCFKRQLNRDPEAIPAVGIPDSRYKVHTSKIVAEDYELKVKGWTLGNLKIRLPELEARAKPLERAGGDMGSDPKVGGHDEACHV